MSAVSQAKIDVAEQVYDDARSLARRQSHDGESRRHHHSSVSDKSEHVSASTSKTEALDVCNIFTASDAADPFITILTGQQQSDVPLETAETRPEPPSSLPTIAEPVVVSSTPTSHAGN